MDRLAAGTRLRIAELVRQPTTVALVVLVPALIVEVYGVALASFPRLPGMSGSPATAGRVAGALFSVAFLAGVVGLFQVISARSGDDRLELCGYPRSALLTTRLAALLAASVVGAAVALLAVARTTTVGAPGVAFLVLLVAALTYGLVGVIVGAVLPRELEGSLVLIFLADADSVLSSGLVDTDLAVTRLFPLRHAQPAFERAVLAGELAFDPLARLLAYAAVALALAYLSYGRVGADGGESA